MNPGPVSSQEETPEAESRECKAGGADDKKGRRSSSRRAPLTPEQQEMALKYIPMARAIARPLRLSWPLEEEEFDSAAMLALCEAARSFDPSYNVKFATFARYRILGALRDVQRALVTAGWRLDLENAPSISSLTCDSEEHGSVIGSGPDPPVGEELEAVDFVESWLRRLPSKHAAACREIYVNGKTQGEAAAHLGCSKSRLSYLHKEAIEIISDLWAYEERLADKSRVLS
jgi:RNA polymerase sigma factor (sigma-70 family)